MPRRIKTETEQEVTLAHARATKFCVIAATAVAQSEQAARAADQARIEATKAIIATLSSLTAEQREQISASAATSAA